MASRKSASDEATVEVVEEVAVDEAPAETVEVAPVEEPAVAPAPAVPAGNPLLSQKKMRGRPNNTWRLYYGNLVFDCVEGVEREFPEEVYEYLKKSGNILPPNF
jgi:hypothetical protein